MAKIMHQILIKSTKVVVQNVRYIVISCDEVTTIDNQSWCSVHVYVIGGFKRMLLLLNLERVIGGINFVDNLTTLILRSLVEYVGLIVEQIPTNLFFFVQMGL